MEKREKNVRGKDSYNFSSTVLIIIEIAVFISTLQFTMKFWSSYNAGDGILKFGILFIRIAMAIIVADVFTSFVARLGNIFNRDWQNPLSVFCQQNVSVVKPLKKRELENIYDNLEEIKYLLSRREENSKSPQKAQEKIEESEEEPEDNFDDGEMKIRTNKVAVPEEEIHYMVYLKKPSGLAYSGEEILLDGIGTVRPIGEVYLEKKDGKMRFMQKVALIED